MSVQPRALLLDTHAAIWLMQGQLSDAIVEAVVHAGLADGVFVSPVSAWEIGLLARPQADGSPRLQFLPDPLTWFAILMAKPIIRSAALTPTIAINASALPGELHRDPADRLLVATARELNVALLTRDDALLAYAGDGHLQALRC